MTTPQQFIDYALYKLGRRIKPEVDLGNMLRKDANDLFGDILEDPSVSESVKVLAAAIVGINGRPGSFFNYD